MNRLCLAAITSMLVLQAMAGQTPTASQTTEQKSQGMLPELAEAAKLSAEATSLYEAGKYNEALSPAKRCLSMRERGLGSDHELIASSLDQVARIYLATGKLSDAESLYRRALAILERTFGTDSRSLIYALEQLGFVRFLEHNYGDGERLYLRAIAIAEKAFGQEHSETARSVRALGIAYERLNKPDKAFDYYKRSLSIEEKALGPDHPRLEETLDHCACALILNNQPEEAKHYQERADKIRNFAATQTVRRPYGVLHGAAILMVEPEYPLAARQARVRGTVIVEVMVDECGKVITTRPLSGPSELRTAAERAARGWRFTAARLAGRPVKIIGTITFNFNL